MKLGRRRRWCPSSCDEVLQRALLQLGPDEKAGRQTASYAISLPKRGRRQPSTIPIIGPRQIGFEVVSVEWHTHADVIGLERLPRFLGQAGPADCRLRPATVERVRECQVFPGHVPTIGDSGCVPSMCRYVVM